MGYKGIQTICLSVLTLIAYSSTAAQKAASHKASPPTYGPVESADPCTDRTPSKKQKTMIDYALRNRADSSAGQCAKYVKNAMVAGYPEMSRKDSDAYTVDIDYNLIGNGFKKCSFIDPTKAAPGCIVISDSYALKYSTHSTPPTRDSMRGDFPSTYTTEDKKVITIDRSGKSTAKRGKKPVPFVPYYGHIEIVTTSKDYPFVSDFGQHGSVINGDPRDLANGWGFNRTHTREYKVLGIYCKR